MKLIMGNKKFEEEIKNNSVYKQIKEKEALVRLLCQSLL